MADYRLTRRARADLDAIADYTMDRWGPAQAERYLSALIARMEWLADHPKAGKDRTDIAPGYRAFREGSHLVFYIFHGPDIAIIGVPHAAMDLPNQLTGDDP